MNLGIALGAGAQEWRKQREDDRLDAREARESEQFGWQRQQHERQTSQQNQMDAVTKKYAALRDQASKGDLSFVPTLMGEYNAQTGAFNDGHTVAMQSTPKGQVMHRIGADGNVVQSYEMNPQTINQLLGEAMMAEMQFASPEMAVQRFDKDREYGLKGREVGTKEEGNRIHAEHFRRSDATTEQYRRDQASMFPAQQELLRAQAGYYRRMPRDDGGGSGGLALTDAQATMLNDALQYEEIAKQQARSNPEASRAYRNASVQALSGLPAKVQLGFRSKFGAPAEADPWDQMVKVKRVDPKTGQEIEMQTPLRVADPEGYATYTRSKAYENIGAGLFAGQDAAPQRAPQPGAIDRLINWYDQRGERNRIDEEDRRSRLGLR